MTAQVDSPDQNAFGTPVTTITRDGAELEFEVKSIAGSYEGKINPELTTISGVWKQGGASQPLVLKRTNAFPRPGNAVTEKKEALVPMRDGVQLALDLYFPSGPSNNLPVALERTPFPGEEACSGRSGFVAYGDPDREGQSFGGRHHIRVVSGVCAQLEYRRKQLDRHGSS